MDDREAIGKVSLCTAGKPENCLIKPKVQEGYLQVSSSEVKKDY